MFKAMNMMKNIEIKPKVTGCRQYTDENGSVSTVTAIIVPIKFTPTDDGTILIGWACNHCNSCHNRRCVYAKAEKSDNKIE